MKERHICDAFVATCMDFRFQEPINKWVGENLTSKGKLHDRISKAGGVKDMEALLEQVGISVNLHQTKEGHLFNHEDCGAYGEEGTPERHAEDLKNAKEVILEKYPDLNISLYYLLLDGTFQEIQ